LKFTGAGCNSSDYDSDLGVKGQAELWTSELIVRTRDDITTPTKQSRGGGWFVGWNFDEEVFDLSDEAWWRCLNLLDGNSENPYQQVSCSRQRMLSARWQQSGVQNTVEQHQGNAVLMVTALRLTADNRYHDDKTGYPLSLKYVIFQFRRRFWVWREVRLRELVTRCYYSYQLVLLSETN
jgi:hypothetical protein